MFVKLKSLSTLFLLILAAISTGCTSSKIKETEVGPAWANNSVNTVIFRQNAITTSGQHQFTAYYDNESYLTLAKRELGKNEWVINRTQYKGNTRDAHNTISLAVDGKGFLHVSWDHHDTDLRYAVSNSPYSLELGEEQKMTGKEENKVSYPQFYNLPQGDLLFMYRSGQSGRGSLVVNRYDLNTRQWKQLHQNLLDGENRRNAYWQATVDREGRIHLSWVWRETWDVSTNHDIAYAVSRDGGETWEKSTGDKYELPITAKTAEYAWKVPQKSNLINQTSMTTDDRGNPYIANYWTENGHTNYKIVYLQQGIWKKEDTGFRNSSFELGGGGTKRIPISRPEILVNSKGNSTLIYILFRDEERENKISLAYKDLRADEEWNIIDLTQSSVGQWEPNYDRELYKQNNELHIFVQKVTQIDGEGLANETSTPIRILKIPKLPD